MESWGILKMIQMHIYQDDASDEAVGAETKVEVDVRKLRYTIA